MSQALTHRQPAARASRTASPLSDVAATVSRLPVPVLIYVLCVVFPLSARVGPLMMTSVRLLLIVMVVPLTIRLLMGKYGRVIATDILFMLHILWATVALAVNNPNRVVEQAGSVGIEFIGGYVLARAYIRSAESFIGLCRLLVLLTLILLPFAVIEAGTGSHPLLKLLGMIPGLDTMAVSTQAPRFGFTRVQGPFAHAIHFGLFCSIVMSLCVVGLKGVMNNAMRLLCGVLIFFTGFLALSSAAVSALALQLALIFWAIVFRKLEWRWWLLFGLFVLAYIAVDILSNRSPVRVFLSYMTFSADTGYWRLLIFDYGMENILANPLFGLGLNNWVRPEWMYTSSVDNYWLLMGMSYGIPGFATVALGYVLVVFHVMRRNFADDLQLARLRRAWVFTFLGLSFMLFTVHVWGNMYSFVFFIFGAGVWFIEAAPQQAAAEGTESDVPDGRRMPAPRTRDLAKPQDRTRTGGRTQTGGGAKTAPPALAPGRKSRFTRF